MRLILSFVILCVFYNESYGKVPLDIDMKLRTLNKPALKTIKSEDGDIIDCIDIYKQHAFDHPALRNHKIQMKPSVEFDAKTNTIPNNGSSKPITSQIWSKSGNCPVGTIPVRRVNRADIMRASSPSHFGRKAHRSYSFLDNALQRKANYNLTAGRLHGPGSNRSDACIVALGFNFLGAQSDINIWNPPGVQAGDYSTGQIWLLGGISSNTFESIEAGWMVNPSVFGDSRTRLFASWTKDAYLKTGCINLLCSGFVQTTTKFALGAAIDPVSSAGGEQYYIAVSMYLDPKGNWWLTCANNVIGYWPGTLFNGLKHSAQAVQWGGEVHSPNLMMHKPHTKTTMGSGDWASSLWKRASFHTNLRIKDFSLQVKYPQYLGEYTDESNCYTTRLHRDTYMSEPHFYFGGPGRNPLCP